MYMTIIRHGESHVNTTDWLSLDTLDPGLTEKGQQQVEALRDWMITKNITADILYTSTMRRTLETSKAVSEALNLEAIPDDRIRELTNNYAGGKPVEEENLPRRLHSDWANKMPFVERGVELPGSESWMHFRTRVGQFMDAMIEQHTGKNVFVVAHGGVIAAMFDNMFNVGPYRRADVHNYNTSWSRFQYREGIRERWYVWDHNRVDHLIANNLL